MPFLELLDWKKKNFSFLEAKSAQKAPTSVISETQEWQSTGPAGLPAGPGEGALGAGTAP